MRASDDERQRVVDRLQRHTAAGRLTLDEFTERVGDVWSARTVAELAALTHDLPAHDLPADAERHLPVRRDLLILFAVAAATLVLLGLIMTLRP